MAAAPAHDRHVRRRSGLVRRLLPPLGGVAAALAAGVATMLASAGALARAARISGLAALVPAGAAGRPIIAAAFALAAGALGWAVLFLLWGPGGLLAPRPERRLAARARHPARRRRADRHPDVPPRPPVGAADLGTPVMETAPAPPAERPLPTDLDQPLAPFDPEAMAARRDTAAPAIDALVRRLEEGAARRSRPRGRTGPDPA